MHFVWIGDGTVDDTRWIVHDIDALPCRDRIHLVSSKPDIQPYFEASDIYVLSSREDPYPIVCVQAMAAGLPVIAFDDVGGAPEALVDGTGVVVPFLDTGAMAQSILDLVRDDAARARMARLPDSVPRQDAVHAITSTAFWMLSRPRAGFSYESPRASSHFT